MELCCVLGIMCLSGLIAVLVNNGLYCTCKCSSDFFGNVPFLLIASYWELLTSICAVSCVSVSECVSVCE